MKIKKASWRTAELTIAVMVGGILSYFITKYYDTMENEWLGGTTIMMIVAIIFVLFFNIVRPEDS